MLKSLKDARRRAVESILETVGASEMTVDQEFDTIAPKFDIVIQELNQCSAALQQMLLTQKTYLSDCRDLAQLVHRVYQANNQDKATWPAEDSETLQCLTESNSFKDSWNFLNDCVRESISVTCVQRTLEPLKDNSIKLSKTIEEEIKSRRVRLKDYDSYRRRLKGLEQKRDAAEAQGKTNTPSHAETLAEIQKFEAKVQNAGKSYETENTKTKQDIYSAKVKHDELIDDYFITVLVSQAEFFTRSKEHLDSIIKNLPQNKVQEIRALIQSQIDEEPKAQPKEPRSFLPSPRLFGSTTSKSDRGVKSEPSPSPAKFSSSTNALPSPESKSMISNPTTTNNATTAMTTTSTSLNNGSKKIEYVIAEYDNEAVDDDEELTFKKGDRIEVLEKDDGGWYKGRLNGREGLFPVNYVTFEK